MQKKLINKIGISIAIWSFLIGTLLFCVFYVSCSASVIFAGYIFTIVALIINLGVLSVLILKSIIEKENRRGYLKTSVIILINIPVAIIYLYFVIILLNTMRITFINDTGKPLTEIKVISFKQRKVNDLEIGENKTVWVDILGDGNICVEYNINEKAHREVVCGYVTKNGGGKTTYRISGKEKNLDNKKWN